ncbi:MAG: arsenate reductase (glutaredoxin) [Flavobacteriales bacterium]
MKIYHNPRCTKSRQTLELLKEKGQNPEVIEYLKSPPSQAELKQLLDALKLPAEDIIRKGETLYKEKYKGKNYSNEAWIKIMVENPILIERPIVVNGKKAALGRPPENVLNVL